MEVSRAEEQAISGWLRDNALPIRHLEAGNGFEDLQPLQQILRDVKIVGLGEATHGTREFVQLKHRLFEFLVIEMDFTVFALEASSAACQPLNDYIVNGVGDLDVALTDQHYVVWDIEEMAALVEWLRRHNSDVPDARKVHFHGVDFSYNENGRKAVLGYLSRVAPERVPPVAALFRALAEEEAKWPVRIDAETQAAIRQLLPKVQALADDLNTNRPQLVRKSSPGEHDRIQQFVTRMEQWCSLDGLGRSRYMADNLISVLDREEPAAKAIIWQHNAHINVQTPPNGEQTLGSALRDKYGAAYYGFALEFNQGSYLTRIEVPQHSLQDLRTVTIGPAPAHSLPWYLATVGLDAYLIDLHRQPANPVIQQWLDSTRIMHNISWAYKDPDSCLQEVAFGTQFDGLIFVEHTTPTRPTRNALETVAKREGL